MHVKPNLISLRRAPHWMQGLIYFRRVTLKKLLLKKKLNTTDVVAQSRIIFFIRVSGAKSGYFSSNPFARGGT